MPKWPFLILLFGLAPSIAFPAADAWAAGKTVDMGYIDAVTILRACQAAGATSQAGGQTYGCVSRDVSVQCNRQTCIATANDLTPLSGDSLDSVVRAMQRHAGRQILPLDARSARPIR